MADRDKHRDNDDRRGFVKDRNETKPDTKGEARGDARETVGNNARGTDASLTGPEGNDRQKAKDRPDEFDRTGQADGRRDEEISES